MVVGHVGGGDDDGRDPQGGDLADGAGPRPADHQVGGPHDDAHVLDVLPHVQIRVPAQVDAGRVQVLRHMAAAHLARPVDVVEGDAVPDLQGEELGGFPVHLLGPQAAPEGDDQGPAIVHAQPGLGLPPGQPEEVPPHRRAGDQDLVRVPVVFPALLEAHHDEVRVVLQKPGGEAGDGVGLVDGGGDAQLCRRPDHGVAGVAPGAHHQIRRKGLQQRTGLLWGAQEVAHRDQVVPQLPGPQGPVEAGHLHRPEGPARRLDQRPLDPPVGPHKQDLAVRPPLCDEPRQGQGGVHMAGGAPTGKYDFHSGRLLSSPPEAALYPAFGAGICLDTDSTIPTSAS